MTLDLASTLSGLSEGHRPAPWAGHEHARGWGVFALPFESGDVLSVFAFQESDFGPYRTLWHRDAAGDWAIYYDAPRADTACPRYYGAACEEIRPAHIQGEWTGPATLRVRVVDPAIDWTLTAHSTPVLDAVNHVSSALPLATWRPGLLVGARQAMARALGLGDLRLRGVMPSGHTGTLMPAEMFFVDQASATFEGRDLGRPVRAKENPRIGGVPLPARGVLARGQGMWRIRDLAEYERTRREVLASA
jgi:hypothetical protein